MTAKLPDGFPNTFVARTLLLGERLDVRRFEPRDSLAAAPLTIRIHEGGVAVLLRYGVVVLFAAPGESEQALVKRLAPYVIDPLPAPESDETRVELSRGADEQADLSGTIHLNDASIERLQVVADVLAKSLVLSHYELRIAGIFDRTEPLATTLRASGRVGRPKGQASSERRTGGPRLEQKMVAASWSTSRWRCHYGRGECRKQIQTLTLAPPDAGPL